MFVQVLDKYNPPDHFLPESYTCFFLLKMPRYSSKVYNRSRLLSSNLFTLYSLTLSHYIDLLSICTFVCCIVLNTNNILIEKFTITRQNFEVHKKILMDMNKFISIDLILVLIYYLVTHFQRTQLNLSHKRIL